MPDAALSLFTGVINRLRGYTALNALVGGPMPNTRIFSAVPQQQIFPFVKVSVMSQPFASSSFSGQQHTVRVQAHSQSGSLQEAMAIRQQVMDALDRQESNITVSGATLIKCEYGGFSDCFIEDDGRTWQSVIEFSVLTQ
jgi:hypothetical protein